MKQILYKQLFNINNFNAIILIFDLKTQIVYMNIVFNTKLKILYLTNNILSFPSFFSIYLFSKKKYILNMYTYNIKNKILFFDIKYKLSIEFIGIGYKLFFNKNFLYFILGHSHFFKIKLPDSCIVYIDNNKILHLIHSNKYILGNIFYIIKSCKKLNIYKGKGIKNIFDQLKLKLGKTKGIKK